MTRDGSVAGLKWVHFPSKTRKTWRERVKFFIDFAKKRSKMRDFARKWIFFYGLRSLFSCENPELCPGLTGVCGVALFFAGGEVGTVLRRVGRWTVFKVVGWVGLGSIFSTFAMSGLREWDVRAS